MIVAILGFKNFFLCLSLFGQPGVQLLIKSFHQHMGSLQVTPFSTCLEVFTSQTPLLFYATYMLLLKL